MTTSRINLISQAILLHTKLCIMYRVYCLSYISNESQVNMKNTNFVTSLLRYNTHCKLLKFIIRDMLFPTKLTSMIDTRRLIDSASLEIIIITDVTVGATRDLNFFGLCITVQFVKYQNQTRGHQEKTHCLPNGIRCLFFDLYLVRWTKWVSTTGENISHPECFCQKITSQAIYFHVNRSFYITHMFFCNLFQSLHHNFLYGCIIYNCDI